MPCPLPARARRRRGDALELPKSSALRDPELCCAPFEVLVGPRGDAFMLASKGPVRDCFGGTAQRLIEEVYRLTPETGLPVLLRDNSEGVH